MSRKPLFWNNINLISLSLIPISIITLIVNFFKNLYLKKKYKIKTICIGNIYLGGTGKTPTSILLANQFLKLNFKPTLVRKYYKNHKDEHALIRNNFKNLILCNNRVQGLKEAIKSNYNLAILDDGLQDYKIKKYLSIVCFNQKQLMGNGIVLPAGPLRENKSALKNAEIILINGVK